VYCLLAVARAQDVQTVEPAGPRWIDRTQEGVYELTWRSAMRLDRMFGSELGEEPYQEVAGSVAPALLYDEFNGFDPQLRFRVDLPLPRLDERFRAFIGRVDREEYVTERVEESGAFRRQYGPVGEEQTLFGIVYREPPQEGGYFDASTGIRLRFPLDPFVKMSYVFDLGSSEKGLLSLRNTVFWQNSEKAGVTSRVELERILRQRWMLRWTTSATFSQRSEGVKGYSSLMALRGFPSRRALAMAAGFYGAADADVPLHEYDVKVAWRQSVWRRWLILEARGSVAWPKEEPEQPRKPSWGVGLGFEMLFGTDQFLARPVTF